MKLKKLLQLDWLNQSIRHDVHHLIHIVMQVMYQLDITS